MRPEKELKGFAKVALQPGETKTVAIQLDFRAFAYYHPAYKQWITEDGEFDILIGASAADIRHTLTVTLESTLRPALHARQGIHHPRVDGRPAGESRLRAVLRADGRTEPQDVRRRWRATDAIGMDFMDMMGDMPLVSVLMWQQSALPMHPEDLVDGLLAQVHGHTD